MTGVCLLDYIRRACVIAPDDRSTPGRMRYPDGGGLTAAGRARRERVRLRAAGMFEQDVSPVQVAHQLRVSTKSAYQWWRRWRAGDEAALASKGPGGVVCRLSGRQLARLRAALEGGPAAWGWDQDQRWTLARVATLIARLFHVRYTLRGVAYLLHRASATPPQIPIHRAAERDEKAIAACRMQAWVKPRG
jgi:transposase